MAISVQSNTTNQAAMAYQSVQSRLQAGNGQVSRPDVKPTATPDGTTPISNGTQTLPAGSSASKAISNATKPAATLELSETGRKLAEQTRTSANASASAVTPSSETATASGSAKPEATAAGKSSEVSRMDSERTNNVQKADRDTRRFEVQATARQAQTATKVAVESKQSSGRASQNGFSQIGQTLDASV